MTEQINQPAEPQHVRITDHEGRLLLIRPARVSTEDLGYGENEVVHADFAVLDGPDAGAKYTDVIIPQRYLVATLKASREQGGNFVLGRLQKGKRGSSGHAGWVLEHHTPDDLRIAQAFLEGGPEALTRTATGGAAPF